MKRRICIIAFKDVRSTIHVLKQIHYLAQRYELTVIGHGTVDDTWPALRWHAISTATLWSKISRALCYVIGRVAPQAYDWWYWHSRRFTEAYEYALASEADAIHANDWQSLPIAVEVARRTGARVLFHQHEYAELEREDSLIWRVLVSPALRYLIRKYATDPSVEAFVTVCDPIAERYRAELGVSPLVVYNAPRPTPVRPRVDVRCERIRLIHHGYAQRGRGIDRMIRAVALADRRFTLDLMLMADDPAHLAELRRLAAELAPDRVRFRAPVSPLDIVGTVTEYDIGLCVIQPSTYNALMMLPNKLFEYIHAGLAVCVGPSPAMASLVSRFAVGVVAGGFTPAEIAAALNRLRVEDIRAMRRAALEAARVLNADAEMAKIVACYDGFFAHAAVAA